MKRKTRIIAVAFVILLMCSALAACGGSDDPIVGKWKMTGAEAMGQTITIEQYLEAANTEDVPVFEFTGSNKVTATGMAGQSGSGEWEVKDGTYTITDSSGAALKATIEDEKLRLEAGGATLIFEKE